MSIYIADLGITRLRELAKILALPGYTRYTDPEQLRNYISTVLTQRGLVRMAWLRQINKSRDQIAQEAEKIITYIQEKKQERKKVPPFYPQIQPSRSDQKLRDSAMTLSSCLEQLERIRAEGKVQGVEAVFGADLVRAVREYMAMDIATADKDLFQGLLQRAQHLERTVLACSAETEQIKVSAVQFQKKFQNDLQTLQNSLQKLSETADKLVKANAALEAEKAKLQSQNRKLVQELELTQETCEKELNRQADQIQAASIRASEREKELLTLKIAIQELEVGRNGKDIESTRFAGELDQARVKLESLLEEKNALLSRVQELEQQLSGCRTELGGCQRRLQECDGAAQLCANTIQTLEGKIKMGSSLQLELEKKAARSDKAVGNLRKNIDKVSRANKECQASLGNLKKQESKCNQQVESLLAEVKIANARIDELERLRKANAVEIVRSSRAVKKLEQKSSESEEKYQMSLRQANRLREALDQAKLDKERSLQEAAQATAEMRARLNAEIARSQIGGMVPV